MVSSTSAARLHAVLTGFVPAATSTLYTAGFAGRGVAGEATLSVMGLVLGAVVGVPLGMWWNRREMSPADFRLPILVGLLCLPMALLPIQPDLFDPELVRLGGWPAVLVGVFAAVPLGACLGTSWAVWIGVVELDRRGRVVFGGLGVGLGVLLATGAVLAFSVFKGAALVNLFAAPLLWPTLPRTGHRSLLARMLLTLTVVISTMYLLFT